jgi:uncharacterized damage-inducible protein DinB
MLRFGRRSALVDLLPWTERGWSATPHVRTFPAILERLAGTPARAAALVAGVSEALLARRIEGKWSVKEHLGHLSDLHALDMRRIDEFLAGAAVLTAADTTNRLTEDRDHGDAPLAQLLETLRVQRQKLFARLEGLTEDEIGTTALHPRLGVPLRLIDWAQFVADHDDHHLAAARMVLRRVAAASRE